MGKRPAMQLSLYAAILLTLTVIPVSLTAQDTSVTVNVTTWQQDPPNAGICGGCVYRTGQNLKETAITNSKLLSSGDLLRFRQPRGFH